MPAEEEKVPLEELEELVEPAEVFSDQPSLSVGSTLQDSERGTRYRVQSVLTVPGWNPPYHFYEVNVATPEAALVEEDGPTEISSGEETKPIGAATTAETEACTPSVLWLWEAASPAAIELLKREAHILVGLDAPMFPKVHAQFEQNGRFYLVTEALPTQTLAEVMEQKVLSFHEFLTLASQVAYALTVLHERGWVHLGLRPQAILMGKPIKLVDFRWAARVGENLPRSFYHPGYSPPELLHPEEPIDERADIFAVGALLYRFITGEPIPETGAQLTGWQCPYSGVPQVVHRCLGPKTERYPKMHLLHQDLVRLKRRYMPVVAYAVAGATTIGLEPSRTTNQDAYGYLAGSVQTEAGSSNWLIACVADGMGGMEAGELASEAAVKTVLSKAATTLSAQSALSVEGQVRLLKEWVHQANEEVCRVLEQKQAKGGTTLLCCLLIEKRLAIAHVGDCRLYWIRDGEMKLLTRDHSLAMALAQQAGEVDTASLRHLSNIE